MPKTTKNTVIKLAVDIKPGPAATPAMKTAWRSWWRRIIASVREEMEEEAKHEQ